VAITGDGNPLVFGEVLFDHFPDGAVIPGGAPFNVACHLAAFGAAPLFVSRIGEDELGRRILDIMRSRGMDCSGMQIDPGRPTGTVEVSMENDEPRFDILADVAWDFIDAARVPDARAAPLAYHGSLALRSAVSAGALDRLLDAGAPIFLDVNLRPPWWDGPLLRARMRAARWVKLNEAELYELAEGGEDLQEMAAILQQDCGLELLIVTLGGRGAMARTPDGNVSLVAPAPSGRLVDTVGAGDAFSSVIILGLLRQWELDLMLERAQSLASAVVGIRGAIPESPDFYTPFINDWS